MKQNNKRIIKYFILSNILVLGIIAAAVFLIPYNKNIITALIQPYNIVRIFIIYIYIFLPVSAGSVFFVFSLTEEKTFKPGTVNYFLSSLNFIIVPLFTVYSFLVLYLNPVLLEKKIWIENLSETARDYRNQLYKNKETDPEKAYIFTNLYLYIDPDNEEINKINDDIYIKLLGMNGKEIKKEENGEGNGFVPELLTGKKLIEISEDFLKRNDYSSAIYYSEIAGKFREYKKSSQNIVDRAEKILKQFVETDPDKKILYNGKLEIEESFRKEHYIDSYYRTVELKKMFPADQELDTHKSQLLKKLKNIAFFYEDVEQFIFIPGKENIIFREKIDNETVIIKCGKIIFADNEVYLFNINSYAEETGTRWTAPFGKIINNSLNMNCISRNEKKFYRPEGKNSRIQITSIPLSYSGEDLICFSGELESIKRLSLLDIITKTGILIKGKFGENEIIIEGAERIIKCINFMMILFISVYSGLSFMKRGKKKNYLSLILSPVVIISVAAADFLLFQINAGIFENLLLETGKLKTFLIFPVLIIFEFITSLYLTVKRSDAEQE